MHAIIFEFWPNEGHQDDYFQHVTELSKELETFDGFISVERFESIVNPGKFVSLSFWESEAAIDRWRNLPRHRNSQAAGRASILADYRLRVAAVIRDYGMNEREQAPTDSNEVHVS